MKPLISTIEHNGNTSVSARNLHQFLEVGRDFSNWIKGRIAEYGFIENQDFEVFSEISENRKGGRPTKEARKENRKYILLFLCFTSRTFWNYKIFNN